MSEIQTQLTAARDAEKAALMGSTAIRAAMRGPAGMLGYNSPNPLPKAIEIARAKTAEAAATLATATPETWRSVMRRVNQSATASAVVTKATGASMTSIQVAIDALAALQRAHSEIDAAAAAIAEVERLVPLREAEIRAAPKQPKDEYGEYLEWDQYFED